ncbi:MAG: hypothetical protein IPI44_21885 [Sulfuritalea sp.]|nr:hypothetical protein [Sulfuritalea sp.]
MVSKNARITRPKGKGWWDDGIVKADQVKAKIDKAFDEDNNLFFAAKIVGSDCTLGIRRGLAFLHVLRRSTSARGFGLPRRPFAPSQPSHPLRRLKFLLPTPPRLRLKDQDWPASPAVRSLNTRWPSSAGSRRPASAGTSVHGMSEERPQARLSSPIPEMKKPRILRGFA